MKKLLTLITVLCVVFAVYSCNSGQNDKKATEKTCCENETKKSDCCSDKDQVNAKKDCCNTDTCKMDKKIVISAQLELKPDMVERFLKESESLIESSRGEEGNISYTLYADPKEKNKFFFFEEWKNQAAVDYHFNTEHFKNFGKLMDEIALVPNKIKIYKVAEEK